jgi:hypothetical protein
MKLRIGCVVVGFLLLVLSLAAQTAGSGSISSQVPPLIPFSSVASDEGGSSLSGVVNITFSLYGGQHGGAALWTETQNNVQLDATGHYSVQLGTTKPKGVPTTLFTTGEARWLGVRIAEQSEQPRVLLLSVPYALKAGDAATIGGLPPSAFMLAAPLSGLASASGAEPTAGQSAPPPSGAVTGTGTVNYLPLWDSTSDIISSVLFQKGTGSSAKIGINTATPATTLDVKGGGTIRGTLSLPATGAATATAGKNSQPLNLAASAFNSTSSTAVNQTFQWQSEPVGNDTSTPSGTLNLLFGEGATKPSETGLNIARNGQINFATGQTFPGTGTITGITTATGSGLTGGGSSGTLNLGLVTTCATNQILQWSGSTWACATISGGGGTVTSVGSGLGLKGGPITTSGTLTIDTTVVPQLAAVNTFTANQTVTGEITAGTGSGSSAGVLGESTATSGQTFGVGGFTSSPAGYGVEGLDVASSGGTAGYFQVNTGSAIILEGNNGSTPEFRVDSAGNVIAAGAVSGSSFQIAGQLFAFGSWVNGNAFLGFAGSPNTNATVIVDTAVGVNALAADTGGYNTAVGAQVLSTNTTGSGNTAIGFVAGLSNSTGFNNTFLGYDTQLSTGSLSNATAIGANAVVSESNALVLGSGANVGIGTSAPGHLLDVAGTTAIDSLGQNNGTGIDLTFGLNAGEGMSSSRTAGPNQYGIDLYTDFNRRISIEQHGNVGIGTTSPDNLLTVNGSADKPGGGSWGTFSDGRLKTVNGGFTDGLSQVMKIHPIHYRYKADNAMGIRDTDEHIGVVAQDVQKVIPEAVTENSKGYLLVNNDPIIWTMLNAIKEQQREIRALRSELRTTRQTLQKVKALVAAAQPALVASK